MKAALAGFGFALAVLDAAAACPADPQAPADTVLSLRVAEEPVQRLGLRDLAAFTERELTQRRSVAAAGASAAPAVEQSVRYGGVLLRDLIQRAPGYEKQARAQRWLVVEAIATDGYRAVFSWGELFNSDAAEQVLVIRTQDGKPLDSTLGPLALRALADVRPGPRHVRNLCAVVVRTL